MLMFAGVGIITLAWLFDDSGYESETTGSYHIEILSTSDESFSGYVDVSIVENLDQFFVGDTVTIYASYGGRVEMENGSYIPLIVAVELELQ